MDEPKKIHVVYNIADLEYVCRVCGARVKTKEELEGKECGGLPPLGLHVGDASPVTIDGLKKENNLSI